jgi:hypothetical protein
MSGRVLDGEVSDLLEDFNKSIAEVVQAMGDPAYWLFALSADVLGDEAAEEGWPHLGKVLCHLDTVEEPLTRAIDLINDGKSESMHPLHRSWLLPQMEGILGLVRERNFKSAAGEICHLLWTMVDPPPYYWMASRLQQGRQMNEREREGNLGSLNVLPCDVLEHIAELVKE